MRRTGVVSWFNDRKGFGFIKDDEGAEIFVNYTEIVRQGFQTLNVGERVSFEVVDEERGPKALHVTPEAETLPDHCP